LNRGKTEEFKKRGGRGGALATCF